MSSLKDKEQDYLEEIDIAKQAIKDLASGSIKMKKVMKLAYPLGDSSGLVVEEKLMEASPPSSKAKGKKVKKPQISLSNIM